MAKDPAFLFYSNDFLSGTYTMSNEQVGKYIRLLCLQHQKGTITERDMMNICGSYDEDIFSKFSQCENGYYNLRLRDEADKRKAYSDSRRKNKLKNKLDNQDIFNTSQSYVQHMENENENENESVIENCIITLFGNFELCKSWKEWTDFKRVQFKFQYKTIQSEVTAINNLHKLSNGKTDIATSIINQSIGNGWKGFFELKNQPKQPTNETRYQARVDYANRHNP